MKIYTGNFANVKKYVAAGLIPISIARFNRYFTGLKLIDLAPPAEIIHDPENSYRPKYEKLLSGLDREKIIEKIKTLTGGKDAILLCYEKSTDFCHRQMVAKWLTENQQVSEFETKKQTEELFI